MMKGTIPNGEYGGYEMIVRVRANDHVAIVLKDKFPDRVEVSAVEINVEGLTRDDLENKELSELEIQWILAHSLP